MILKIKNPWHLREIQNVSCYRLHVSFWYLLSSGLLSASDGLTVGTGITPVQPCNTRYTGRGLSIAIRMVHRR